MFQNRVIVFKEIYKDDQLMFQHYRLGAELEDFIVPAQLLTEKQHWELLEQD